MLKTIVISPDNKRAIAALKKLKADKDAFKEFIKNGGKSKNYTRKHTAICSPFTTSH